MNADDWEHHTPLHVARSAELARALVLRGAYLRPKTTAFESVLHTQMHNAQVLQYLLQAMDSATLHTLFGWTTASGCTLLHRACEVAAPDSLSLVLHHCPSAFDAAAKNTKGVTALQVLLARNFAPPALEQCLKWLVDKFGVAVLQTAAELCPTLRRKVTAASASAQASAPTASLLTLSAAATASGAAAASAPSNSAMGVKRKSDSNSNCSLPALVSNAVDSPPIAASAAAAAASISPEPSAKRPKHNPS